MRSAGSGTTGRDGGAPRSVQVATPSEDTDRMVNVWNAYQCMVTLNLSRSASYFDTGRRARHRIPRLEPGPAGVRAHGTRARPRTHPGPGGDTASHRWRVPPVPAAHEARERRDRLGLQRRPALADPRGRPPTSRRPATARSSTSRSPTTASRDRRRRSTSTSAVRSATPWIASGPHGLPLIGRADWNDCLNLNTFSEEPGESFQTAPQREGGVAESVFIAGQFVLAAEELAAARGAARCSRRRRSVIGRSGRG